MKAKTVFSMKRANGYGQYKIVKTTPSGKQTQVHCTDSELWDNYTEDKVSQAKLKRVFNWQK